MSAFISIFDMLKIGVGPSSSHTLGPWKAAGLFLKDEIKANDIVKIRVDLFGSLSLTGKGHATDIAVLLGLSGFEPETIHIADITNIVDTIKNTGQLKLGIKKNIVFDYYTDIVFNKTALNFHPNGIRFTATTTLGGNISEEYFSIGGGFVLKEHQVESGKLENLDVPYPINNGFDLAKYCDNLDCKVSDVIYKNELSIATEQEINEKINAIWQTMLDCMYDGCHTEGTLPGGLKVHRRAFDIHNSLMGGEITYNNSQEWLEAIRNRKIGFREILKYVSCFALAVNEVNASLGRVVTAPTNGSAGVIPAVLMYYLVIENHQSGFEEIKRFLMVASEIGSIFKKGATISAAMGGCQAEIGVSSAMAAAALCELIGGTPAQVLIAAEIAMEHHLGLTCDPIGGLVQIPCIERNAMGAIKAINAAELALTTDVKNIKVPLDKVVNTMWETALDMNTKYKETSEGGLALGVNMVDC
jgi:L-serine dehydratase